MSEMMTSDARALLRTALLGDTQINALVVGDVMLDRFLYCESARCSPEDPSAKVLTAVEQHDFLGGAANVAANAAALGARTTLIGARGTDAEGEHLERMASERGIATLLHIDESRPTTTKIRYLLSGAHYMRHDRESRSPIDAEFLFTSAAIGVEGPPQIIYISDYAKGVISDKLVTSLRQHYADALIVADGKPQNVSAYSNVDVFKINAFEAHEITGMLVIDDDSAAEVVKSLSRRLNTAVVLTRGKEGMTLARDEHSVVHIRVPKVEREEVTGAGDTTLAALGYMLAHGASLELSAEAAAIVAGIAVSKKGTTAPSREEILSVLSQ